MESETHEITHHCKPRADTYFQSHKLKMADYVLIEKWLLPPMLFQRADGNTGRTQGVPYSRFA